MNGRLIRRKKSSGKSLKKANVVKGQWTLEEDRKLVKLVQQFGLRKWSHIAQMLPGRVGKQCRERWHNHLRPNIKKDTWSEEEDIVLIQTHKEVGNKWAEIAKHLPGRTENSIKNHWNATKRRQFARRRSRASSKNPKSGTLLQNYIKSLGIGPIKSSVRLSPLEQPTVSSSPANTQKLAQVNGVRTGSNLSNQMVTQETLSMDENDDIQTNTCEEFQLLVSTYGDLCLDMCDHLFETKEEAPYQVYNIDGDDVDMNYIFNHIDYANKIGHEIEDMEMAWDDDVLELEDNESGSSPLETPAVHVKEEMDLVEMVTRTQFAASG
ncbi:transcription factor MYB119-like isoform X2 [Oryza brachyantha]|nr:transcription factor MYB119-like isoform X2 [Oryza brachyantha]XP_015694369.1 transcription factor MYB119-like isoform X2 [Oryza brachyantha]